MTDAQKQLLKQLDIIRNSHTISQKSLELLVALVQKIRPHAAYFSTKAAEQQLLFLIDSLKHNPATLQKFRTLLQDVFINTDISEVLTESGLQSERGFFFEFNKRIKYKLLPPLKNKGSFLYAINAIFYKKNDYKWIEDVDDAVWVELFELMGLELHVSNEKMLYQLFKSLYITSSRVSSLGVEPDIRRCLSDGEQMSFIRQSQLSRDLIEIRKQHAANNEYHQAEYNLLIELSMCEQHMQKIQDGISEYGTSLHQTYIMMRLKQLLERMRIVLDIISNDEKVDLYRVVRHFKITVQNENTKNSIRSLMVDNVDFLAYRIAEHERNTGEHYITTTRSEYWKMFKSAMGGGVIISFVAIIKNLFHFIKMAPFWQGFAYSVNYAAGFITIYTTGATLATKQPAMTASTIASSLDDKKSNTPNLPELAILISEVMRSQTASFIGNLMIVFPLTLAMAYGWEILFGFPIADAETAQKMIDAQHPLRSLSLLYACFTGVFLYLSGIISGYFDNLVVYGNIPQRLREHQGLKRTFKQKTINKIANYTEKHLGGLMGNLSLGFFLGMAGFVGYIFGISFDIRHITISTGNFAIGLQGLAFDLPCADIIWTTFGVLMIGFFNFLVSFLLAFFTALASRKVRFRQYHRIVKYVVRLLWRYPLDFIRPPKTLRKPDDFIHHKRKK